MKIICDTNALLFWADQRHRLTPAALAVLEAGRAANDLACSDISTDETITWSSFSLCRFLVMRVGRVRR